MHNRFIIFFEQSIQHAKSFCTGGKNDWQKSLKKRFEIGAVLVCFFFNLTALIAQPLIFSHLNIENGLSDRSVLAIAQDDKGFMWFGTKEGLNRFDSRSINVYQTSNLKKNLPSFYVMSLLSDSYHTLWIGTASGLGRYHPETTDFEQIRFLSVSGQNWDAKNVACIYEDRQHQLWFGTEKGLFLLIDRQKLRFKFIDTTNNKLPDNNIRTILEDDAGTLWVGTANGLSAMQKNGNTYTFKNFKHEEGNNNRLSGNNISALAQDSNHTVWVGTVDKGINRYDAQKQAFSPFQVDDKNAINNHIRRMAVDKQGNLWLGTQNGLTMLNIKTNEVTNYQHNNIDNNSLSQNSVYSLFFDKENTLWTGTYFGGVNHIVKSIFNIHQNKTGLSGANSNVTSSMAEDKNGNLWIGTEGGGLNFIDRKANTVESFTTNANNPQSLGSDLVKTIYKDNDNNIWVGTHGGGLNLLNADGKTFTRYLFKENDPSMSSTEIYSVAEDADGLFWVATKDEWVKVFKRSGTQLTPYSTNNIPGILQHARIFCMFKDSKNNFWAAGDGLYVRNNNSNGFHIFGNDNEDGKALNNLRINCLKEDLQGNIWIGTHANGIYCYTPSTNKLLVYNTTDGLPNNNVLGILEAEHNNLWISTSNGLCNFDTKQRLFRTYTTSDGLPANEFNNNSYLKTKNGELFFGGVNGFVSFLPDNTSTNKTVPNIFITGLKLFNQPVEINGKNEILKQDISYTKNIRLKYDQNMLAIDFALLSFSRSEKTNSLTK